MEKRIQIAKDLALNNIIKYVSKVGGYQFLANKDKTIAQELDVLIGEVKESINEK